MRKYTVRIMYQVSPNDWNTRFYTLVRKTAAEAESEAIFSFKRDHPGKTIDSIKITAAPISTEPLMTLEEL